MMPLNSQILNNYASIVKPSGNSEMSGVMFENWRKYIYDMCGIYFQDNKKYLLESRLKKRINFLGLNTYSEYYDYLTNKSNAITEKRFLYEAITINETFFFRNQQQLDALITSVLPEIIEKKLAQQKNKIRIWSAASSSGEEAYSVAICIVDLMRNKYPNIEYEIVGTDISTAVLDIAKKGIFKEYSIRNTPPYYLKKYFKSNGTEYEIDPVVKKMVSFKLLNLYDELGMKGMMNYDVIFCANVLIYFDHSSKMKVISNIYNSLNKGGYLFIGYSETLQNISKSFKLISYSKTIGYKKE
jgi:chemotaxis protein methyltransferase CheR